MSESIYERVGGEAAVNAAVDLFYKKVLADESLKRFFEGVDTERLMSMQRSFLTLAFGGPNNYSGRDLRDAHLHLVEDGLNEEHFGAVAGHLQSTLEELQVAKELIGEIMTIAASTKNDVLNQ